MPSIDEYFAAGIKRMLAGREWGAQSDLARFIGVDKAYCNQMLHGKRRIVDKWKEKMAEFFQKDVLEIMQVGKAYLDENTNFPWIVDAMKITNRLARTLFILENMLVWNGYENKDAWTKYRDAFLDYNKGDFPDDEMVRTTQKFVESLIK